MIACTRVSKSYDGRAVLTDVNLAVQPGEWVTVVGGSGSGKTTLVRLLLRAEEADGGTIDVDGVALESLPPPVLQLYRARVGTAFQEPRLLPHDSLLDNVLLPLDLQGAPAERSQRVALSVLKRLGLSGREKALPSQLSHAEQSLANLARSLVHNPMILLADEPFALLDQEQTAAALALLRDAHASGMTVLLLTRDIAAAATLPGRRVRLERGTLGTAERAGPVSGSRQPHRILEQARAETPAAAAPAQAPTAIRPVAEEARAATPSAPAAPSPMQPAPPKPSALGVPTIPPPERPSLHHRAPPMRKNGPRVRGDAPLPPPPKKPDVPPQKKPEAGAGGGTSVRITPINS